MKGESLVHLKFNYQEALTGKREILYSEKILVNFSGIIKRYAALRTEELKLKLKLHRKTKELISKLKKVDESFPHLDFRKLLHKETERNETVRHPEKVIKVVKEHEPDNEIEAQLRDIQRKLNAISG